MSDRLRQRGGHFEAAHHSVLGRRDQCEFGRVELVDVFEDVRHPLAELW